MLTIYHTQDDFLNDRPVFRWAGRVIGAASVAAGAVGLVAALVGH